MAEARKIVDGDIFELKLSSGQVQWIEGDRIRTPFAGLPSGLDPARINHGVILGNAGEAMGYVVCRRAKTNDVGLSGQDMAFERVLRSAWVYHHASWDLGRFDQVRGISPLASATNSFRDVYEGVDYALVKAKVAQMFALAIMRDAAPDEAGVSSFANEGAPGEEGSEDTETCTTTSEEEGSAYKDLDINRGPLVLDMEPGDKAEILESATPSTEFQNFLPLVIQIALKAIDLPYSFYDEAWTNYSGQKQAWALYEKSAEVKRSDNRDLLDDWTRWRLGAFIDDGILELPAGMQLRDLKWAWRHAGTPWLDQLKEAVGKIAAIEASIESPIDVIEETTDKDWTEVLDDKAAFLKAHDDRGIPRPAWGIDQGKVMQDSAPAGEGEGGGGKDAKKGGPNMNTKTNRKSAYELGLEMVAAQREEAARE